MGISLSQPQQKVKRDRLSYSSPIYRPLKSHTRTIRLVKIETPEYDGARLRCQLVHRAFDQIPTYYALSYRWGDESAQKRIILNGSKFPVRRNLYDALRFLQNRDEDVLIWIDAICINQDDFEERSQQVRIMHLIYQRATKVVIWLGKKHANYPVEEDTVEVDLAEGPDLPSVTRLRDFEALVRELCSNEYWERLWIIQEIGNAAALEVCFGRSSLEWTRFIEMVTQRASVDNVSIPLKLHRQRMEKYRGAHTLHRLLETHQSALCQDRRDKIYGLVGLAMDASASEFPIDYRKSLLEVAEDTVHFMLQNGSLQNKSEHVPLLKLVKFVLVRSMAGDKFLSAPNSRLISTVAGPGNSMHFSITCYVVGSIYSVGCSIDNFVSDIRVSEEWKVSCRRTSHMMRETVEYENDQLMRILLQKNNTTSLASLCFAYSSNVLISHPGIPIWRDCFQMEMEEEEEEEEEGTQSNHHQQFRVSRGWARFDESRATLRGNLCQIRLLGHSLEPGAVGIVTEAAAEGDTIYGLEGLPFCLVVRGSQSGEPGSTEKASIVGTALQTGDLTRLGNQTPNTKGRARWLGDNPPVDRKTTITINARDLLVLIL